MFEPIKSFTVDHKKLTPGVYERDLKDSVKTWDIRFKTPNNCNDDFMSSEVVHTLEHFLATYFKNVMSDVVYGVFPMGCLTGFYILTKECVTKRTMLLCLLGAHAYINSENEVPGATEESCGNYLFHNIKGAREAMNEFYSKVLINAELEVYQDLLKPIDDTIYSKEDSKNGED